MPSLQVEVLPSRPSARADPSVFFVRPVEDRKGRFVKEVLSKQLKDLQTIQNFEVLCILLA